MEWKDEEDRKLEDALQQMEAFRNETIAACQETLLAIEEMNEKFDAEEFSEAISQRNNAFTLAIATIIQVLYESGIVKGDDHWESLTERAQVNINKEWQRQESEAAGEEAV